MAFHSQPDVSHLKAAHRKGAIANHQLFCTLMQNEPVEVLQEAVGASKSLLREHCAHLVARYFVRHSMGREELEHALTMSNRTIQEKGLCSTTSGGLQINLLALDDEGLSRVYLNTPEVHLAMRARRHDERQLALAAGLSPLPSSAPSEVGGESDILLLESASGLGEESGEEMSEVGEVDEVGEEEEEERSSSSQPKVPCSWNVGGDDAYDW